MDSVILSPGERAEILVNFSRYEPGNTGFLKVDIYNGEEFFALKFSVAPEQSPSLAVPTRTTEIERISPESAQKVRHFTMRSMGRGAAVCPSTVKK